MGLKVGRKNKFSILPRTLLSLHRRGNDSHVIIIRIIFPIFSVSFLLYKDMCTEEDEGFMQWFNVCLKLCVSVACIVNWYNTSCLVFKMFRNGAWYFVQIHRYKLLNTSLCHAFSLNIDFLSRNHHLFRTKK